MLLGKRILTAAVVLAFSVSSAVAAAPKSGKVRLVIGDVTFQKGGKAKWQPLRVDAKVKEKDRIKTAFESTASIAFPDGSIVAVAELSEVEFAQLLFADGSQVSMVDVKQGQVRFDAQKQKEGSSFKFKTGTATCSIRGTDGIVGVTKNGQSVGSLNSGAMDMEQDGQKVSIGANQFVAFRKGKAPVVGEAKNAGDPEFMKMVAEVVDDTTKSDADIVATAKAFDEKIEKEKAELRAKYSCKFDNVPATVDVNTVKIGATCTAGMEVSIGAETIKSTGEKMTFSPSWEKGAFGDKKFVVMCSAEKKMFECGRLATVYKVDREASFGNNDEGSCTVAFITKGFDENKGSLKLYVGDSLLQQMTLNVDTSGVFKLVSGTNVYKLVSESADPKVGTVTRKLKCYPSTEVAIEFKGGKSEIIRKKLSQGAAAYPDVEFSVRNVLDNDPKQIKSVLVKINGKSVPTKIVPSDVGLGYRAKLRLDRGKVTKVFVEVTMHNGKVVSAEKTFELR
jgi:hypothetical protein